MGVALTVDTSGIIFLLVFLLAGNPGCLENEILSLDEVTGGWPAARHRALARLCPFLSTSPSLPPGHFSCTPREEA